MIEVGEYVRTKNKGIQKIAYLRPNATVNKYAYFIGYDNDGDRLNGILKTTDILKHSKNIIDLIEVGDIVKVLDIDWVRIFNIDNKDTLESFIEDLEEGNWKLLSIVTKEQFKSIEYEV